MTAIAAGGSHTCALANDGAAWCWGEGSAGQLGNGSTEKSSTPVAVTGLSSGVTRIAAGGEHTCAITTAGAVLCWGSDSKGQLGDGGSNTNQPTPVAVTGLSSGVTAIAAGGAHTCAITNDGGAARCWGADNYGQLGDGSSNTDQSSPVGVSGLFPTFPNQIVVGVTAIAAGMGHTCALIETGAVWCWGLDGYGQLGDAGSNTNRSTPFPVSNLSGVTRIAVGDSHTCAVVYRGIVAGTRVLCWGSDSSGQIGNGGGNAYHTTPAELSGFNLGVSGLAAGGAHTCAVARTLECSSNPPFLCSNVNSLKCWGADFSGQLGDGGSNTKQYTPVVVTGLSSGVSAVAAGYAHTCALTSLGVVKCWGGDYAGQLGDGGSNTDKTTPVAVTGCTGALGGQVIVTRVNQLAGLQGLKIKGEFNMGAPLVYDDIYAWMQPYSAGFGMTLLSATGTPLYEVTLPPGFYSTTTGEGWKRTATGAQWQSKTGISGVTKVKLKWDILSGRGSFDLQGKNLSLAVTAADLPLHAEVRLDPSTLAAGRCGATSWAHDWVFNASGSTLLGQWGWITLAP